MDDILQTMMGIDGFSNIKFLNIVAEDIPEISLQYNIEAVPTILLFEKGLEVARVNGVNPTELSDKVKKYLLHGTYFANCCELFFC